MVLLSFSSPETMKNYHPVLDKMLYRRTSILFDGKDITQNDVVKLLKKFVCRLPSALMLYIDALKPDFFTLFTPDEIHLFKTVKILFIRLPFTEVKVTNLFLQSIVCYFSCLEKLTIYIDQVHTLTEKSIRILYRKTRFDGFIPRFSKLREFPHIIPTFNRENPDQRFLLPKFLIEEIDDLSNYAVPCNRL